VAAAAGGPPPAYAGLVPRADPRNASRYWLHPRLQGLSLLLADFTTHEFAPHYHDALLVAATEDGGSEVAAAGVPDEVHRSALLVVDPAEAHSSRMSRSARWRYRSFYLMRSALDDVAAGLDLARFPSLRSGVLQRPDLVQRFLRLHRALEENGDELLERELLVGAFGHLVAERATADRPASLRGSDRVVLGRVVALMRERHAEHLTLPVLAAATGTTQFQLIDLFRAGTGMTPHAFLTQIRLGAACHHLRRSRPIAEAAVAAGFYDQSALTRHFKRAYGMTPLQYVRAISA
jgi:AraC-like DNA-binding protein